MDSNCVSVTDVSESSHAGRVAPNNTPASSAKGEASRRSSTASPVGSEESQFTASDVPSSFHQDVTGFEAQAVDYYGDADTDVTPRKVRDDPVDEPHALPPIPNDDASAEDVQVHAMQERRRRVLEALLEACH